MQLNQVTAVGCSMAQPANRDCEEPSTTNIFDCSVPLVFASFPIRFLLCYVPLVVKEDNLLKAAIRAQDTVDAVKPKGARARLSTTSRKQSDALHDVRLSVRSSARGDPDEALELPWTAGQLFIEDLPLSAAPPSSWALAISEQSELALSRLQMSRLRLKSVPTETSLEAVLAHIATSDLLLGRIASLREAYPELESHILVEQAKTRILQGLKQAWSSLHVGEASAQKLRIKLVDCVSRASADIRTKAASEFEGLGLQKMLDYLQKLAWEAGRQQGLVRLVSEWSLENDDFIDDSDVKMKNRSLMGFLKRFRRGTLRVSDVASIQPELQTDVRQLAPQSQADTATGAQHSTSSGSGSLLDVLLGTSASATAPGQEAFLPPHPPYPHVPPSYPHPQSPFAPSSSFHPPFGHSSATPDPSGPASHATDYEDESGDDGVDTVSSAISHSLIDRLLDTLASPEAPEEVQESAGSMLDEGLLLDDVMAMIDEELGTVPGGSSPAHSVPSPPDEQHLLDELIPSLDPQDDTGKTTHPFQ
ncbi:hypothetical protein TGGT1_408920 [Toxoplasma gondii GT1]|uniref:Uncharacterized protein n=1 Tax=Toxoplasma gondii (strain ATCC 50853 / GT1) TaxID=507601 RepID=S7UZ50_TOXGG|nr:hypothetical protein TGGT1_408920 [Toxoplasma gondii GT1]